MHLVDTMISINLITPQEMLQKIAKKAKAKRPYQQDLG